MALYRTVDDLPKKKAVAQKIGITPKSDENICSKNEQAGFDEIVANTVELWHGYRQTA